MIFHLVLLVILQSSTALSADPSADGWKQISNLPVCVIPRDDGYGHLQYAGDNKLVAALKLKYISGQIRCTTDVGKNSRWGCAKADNPLNIIVTDEFNHVIFPLPEFIKEEDGMWYHMPLVDAVYSDELVFADFSRPFYLNSKGQLRFWYGEDLASHSEGDNQGQVCFHVLALFV